MQKNSFRLTTFLVLLGFAVIAQPATGQEMDAPEPQIRENVSYYSVWHVKFKPGKAEEARDIIYDRFWPIDQVIGREVIPFDHLTGHWDHSVYFHLEGGPADLAYDMIPSESEWFAALADQEGGMEAAEALMDRFGSLIADSGTELVYSRSPSTE